MLRADDLFRVLTALIADELAAERGAPVPIGVWSAWRGSTSVDEAGLGVDSLERLSLVGRVNEFFHLHEVGTEDYLMVERTLGAWVEVVRATLEMRAEALTFRTSGSTGEPKRAVQPLRRLNAEIDALTALFITRRRVLSLVPPHHIYGFLFGALLPARLEAEVIDLRCKAPGAAAREARPGDLVVATPHLWEHALAGAGGWADDVVGVSSSAAMPTPLRAALQQQGLGRLVEIYGSSETAGVGWREAAEAPFALFDHWAWEGEDLVDRTSGARLAPPDQLAWSAGGFLPVGRRDGAVQVAGVNVYPGQVEAVIASHPDVRACAVRRDGNGAAARLKAFVAPIAPEVDPEALRTALIGWCAERLPAAARPQRYAFGPELPRNAMGKAADWPDQPRGG